MGKHDFEKSLFETSPTEFCQDCGIPKYGKFKDSECPPWASANKEEPAKPQATPSNTVIYGIASETIGIGEFIVLDVSNCHVRKATEEDLKKMEKIEKK